MYLWIRKTADGVLVKAVIRGKANCEGEAKYNSINLEVGFKRQMNDLKFKLTHWLASEITSVNLTPTHVQ